LFAQDIKTTGLDILLDLLVPLIGPILVEPLRKLGHVARRELSDRGFQFVDIHARSNARLEVFSETPP
jgi:hypothetical protein